MKCCFIGHRDSTGVENRIRDKTNALIKIGIKEFYSGGMGNFDKMCEKVVKEAGGKITLVAYNTKQIKEDDYLWYDEIICTSRKFSYSKFDIPNRNKWMVKHSDCCLCYVFKEGGAKHTLNYAIKENKQIIHI